MEIFQKLRELGLYAIPVVNGTKKPPLSLEHLGGFTGISANGYPENIAEDWDFKYPIGDKFGLALVMGPASGIFCVDLDTDDDKLLEFLPDTPLIRKGDKKRIGSHYYSDKLVRGLPKLRSAGSPEKDDAVDFLNINCISVIPPTMHKSGVAYQWVGEIQDILEFNKDELPEITKDTIDKIRDYYSEKYPPEDGYVDAFRSENIPSGIDEIHRGAQERHILRCAHGSLDRIKYMAGKLANESDSVEQLAEKLYEYDKKHHLNPSYFADKSRGKDSKDPDPKVNAYNFCVRMLKSFKTNPIEENQQRKYEIEQIKEEHSAKGAHLEGPTQPPAAFGFIKDFIECANARSFSDMTPIATASAICVLSSILGNRRCIKLKNDNWPANIMAIVVANSGIGKDASQQLTKKLLLKHGVISNSDYTSAAAIFTYLDPCFKAVEKKKKAKKQFPDGYSPVGNYKEEKPFTDSRGPASLDPEHPALKGIPEDLLNKVQTMKCVKKPRKELLAIIDEADIILGVMSDKSAKSYEKRLQRVFTDLYSSSKSSFGGQTTKGEGLEGAVTNPYFSFLGSTQKGPFEKAINGDIVSKGIYQRSLIFHFDSKNDITCPENVDYDKQANLELEDKLEASIDEWFEFNTVTINSKGLKDTPDGLLNYFPVSYQNIPLAGGALELIESLSKKFYKYQYDLLQSERDLEASVVARLFEKVIKLSAIAWAADQVGANPERIEYVSERHVQWAHDLAVSNYKNSENDFKHHSDESEDKIDVAVNKFMRFLERQKNHQATWSLISRGKAICGNKRNRDEIINECVERGLVEIVEIKTAARPKRVVKIV